MSRQGRPGARQATRRRSPPPAGRVGRRRALLGGLVSPRLGLARPITRRPRLGRFDPAPSLGFGGYLSPQPRPSLAGVGAAVVSVAQLARPPLRCLAGGQRKLARRRGTIAAMDYGHPHPDALLSRLHRRRQAGGQRQGRIAREEHGRQLTPLVAPRGLAAPGSGPAAHEHSATRQRTGKRCRRSRLPGPDADRLASEHLPQGGRLMPTAFVPSSGRFCHHLLTRMRSLERLAPRSDRARKASSASGGPLLTSAGRSKGGCWRANRRHEATTAPPRSCGRDSNRMRRGQQLACRLLAENHAAVRIAEPIGRVRLAAAPIRSIRSGPLSPAPCPRDSPLKPQRVENRAQPWPSPPPLLAACQGTEGSMPWRLRASGARAASENRAPGEQTSRSR